jgi:uncharacterized protein YjbI with pentapeptide repeats
VQDNLFKHLAHFEEGSVTGGLAWLGSAAGLAVGVVLTIVGAGATVLSWTLAFSLAELDLVSKVLVGAPVIVVGAVVTYWRRQRLAAHFEKAARLLDSADGDARQNGLAELILNARRGRAEHGRIARALTAYLRRAPHDHPTEAGRRQLAFSMLADYTLSVAAKRKLDLTGAMLAGVRAPSAELAGACLRGADLTGANLARADLNGADLQDARLDGANLAGARLGGTILAGKAG